MSGMTGFNDIGRIELSKSCDRIQVSPIMVRYLAFNTDCLFCINGMQLKELLMSDVR